MSTPEHVEVIDVLLVEDDPGDVLLIEEAFADNKVRNRLHTVSDGVDVLTLQSGLQFVGMLDAANGLDLACPADCVGLALGSLAGGDRQATRKQIVAAVAVLDLDGIAGGAEVVDLSSKNQFHLSCLSLVVLPAQRVDELNGSSATSRAFLTAIAMSRWC